MRLTSKGQVTIPRLLSERYGLLPDTEVSFEPAAGCRCSRAMRHAIDATFRVLR